MNKYQEIIQALAGQRILVTGHLTPDADCVSAMLALYQAFDGQKKGWQLVLEDDINFNLRYLPGCELIKKPQDLNAEVDAVLLVDCHESSRASTGWLDIYADKPLYVIDHHRGQNVKADVLVLDPHSSAAALLVYQIIKTARQPLTTEIALLLYSGIVADTGCFRFSNTNKATFEAAADLIDYDVDLQLVRINLFERRSLANTKIIAAALTGLELFHEGRLCLLSVDLATKKAVQAMENDCGNVVGNALMIEGVKFGFFLEERLEGIKVSMRCREGYSVDDLAASCGGGGHAKAAGCTINTSLAEAKEILVAAVGKVLKEG
ncbi:MAG: DHH family phosphoesterase [Bacillota bacterium]|jgi:phosphoesterase RecJ-like protein